MKQLHKHTTHEIQIVATSLTGLGIMLIETGSSPKCMRKTIIIIHTNNDKTEASHTHPNITY